MSKNNVVKRRISKKKKIDKSRKNHKNHNKKLSVFGDLGTILHYICAGNGLINVKYDFNKLFLYLSDNVERNDKKKMILEVINNLEKLIRETLEEFSVYEMIYFSRRIRPENVFECKKDEILLYRNIMSLAFQKYCKGKDEYYYNSREYSNITEYALPSRLKGMDKLNLLKNNKFELLNSEIQNKVTYAAKLFNICYIVESYCYYHVYLLKQYRTLCKGGQLKYSNKYGVVCVSDEELIKKTRLLDTRKKHFNIISSAGGYADTKVKQGDIQGLDDFIILQFQENLEEIKFEEGMSSNDQIISIGKDQVTNYFPVLVNLKKYYNYANNFKEEFYKYYDFSIQDFFIFMLIICKNNIIEMSLNVYKKFHMFQRGYTLYEYDVLKQNFKENYDNFTSLYNFSRSKDVEGVFKKIFNFLTFSNDDKKEINLKAINEYKVFIKIDEKVGIIDYTNWGRILEELMIPICKMDDKKGEIFENIVIEKIKDEFGENSLWVTKRELKANGQKREIDVSFVIGDLLVILECKAINYSLASCVGDQEAVKFRQMKIENAIKQADKTLRFIEDNQKDLNIKIPNNINGIVSLIVTQVPEYIWELSDNLMINETLPRVLSVEELNEIKKADIIEDIHNTKFYRKIN